MRFRKNRGHDPLGDFVVSMDVKLPNGPTEEAKSKNGNVSTKNKGKRELKNLEFGVSYSKREALEIRDSKVINF